MNPGTIVKTRNRDWIVLPSDDPELLVLKPLAGGLNETIRIHEGLARLTNVAEERVRPSAFPLPTPEDVSDATGAYLLWQAARLSLRDGASPFRSLGRISIRPRVYQFVPLLMGLRLDPIRMLIADDVGVGKTIEALLLAREMLDRGEIRRMIVLCPPYLCEQWQRELKQKFNLEAEIIRSSTIRHLESTIHGEGSIYRKLRVSVASIDFLKTPRNRAAFLQDCPEFVIVDEAHGSASTHGAAQQRHELLKQIAANERRHLVLLTATPHSGIESAFQSLLGLLQPSFSELSMGNLSDGDGDTLAKHFVQRTRRDIEASWEEDGVKFPQRIPMDLKYSLSGPYLDLFNRTYDFCTEIVRTGEHMEMRKRRVQYWAALGLLRCVMSSPAAALAALENRREALGELEDEPEFASYVMDSAEEPSDEQPVTSVETAGSEYDGREGRQLKEIARLAEQIGLERDGKFQACATWVEEMINKRKSPIVWCRYVATAETVAEALDKRLGKKFPGLRVISITGRIGDEERRQKIDEIQEEQLRVLVATDCLSEGINLQQKFDSCLHYDLPWNPNRLEQREGRVDRFGQQKKEVDVVRLWTPDSPVDGVVIRVLLDKAREIHKALGTHVPVPEESDSVTEALMKALFFKGRESASALQLSLDLEVPEIARLNLEWDRAVGREKTSRTKFQQRSLKPEEVREELEATDDVLGDEQAVKEFVLSAAQRLALTIAPDKAADLFRVLFNRKTDTHIPLAVREAIPEFKGQFWRITFTSPGPENAEYLGRNHKFVATLAQFLLEEALSKSSEATASRSGAIASREVREDTKLYLVRARYLVQIPDRPEMVSEEVVAWGRDENEWLPETEVKRLLRDALPDKNLRVEEKKALVASALHDWKEDGTKISSIMVERAQQLAESHRRIRQAVSLRVREVKVEPLPADLLGVLVLKAVH